MNDWEKEICSRVRTVREAIRWTQSDFAAQIGLSRDQLAGIEGGRTPLTYAAAWRIHAEFGINLEWLDEGFGSPDSLGSREFPTPNAVSRRSLLSNVLKDLHNSHLQHKTGGSQPGTQPGVPPFIEWNDDLDRYASLLYLREFTAEWIASAPTGQAAALTDRLTAVARDFLSSFPAEPRPKIEARIEAFVWDRIRVANAKKILSLNSMLTDTSASEKIATVGSLEQLLVKVARLAKGRGKKAALSRALGIAPETLSRYLSRKIEPGGETTLRLLKWVELQERKQKAPAVR